MNAMGLKPWRRSPLMIARTGAFTDNGVSRADGRAGHEPCRYPEHFSLCNDAESKLPVEVHIFVFVGFEVRDYGVVVQT
jgi:hypothetical protein